MFMLGLRLEFFQDLSLSGFFPQPGMVLTRYVSATSNESCARTQKPCSVHCQAKYITVSLKVMRCQSNVHILP